jgi:outer membrane murein-binding lipoprotein Lpp
MVLAAESTLAGVGVILTGLGGLAALIESVRKWMRRGAQTQTLTLAAIDELSKSLNHLDEPIGDNPSIGQLINRIDARVDKVDVKIDQLHTDVRSLSNAMLAHITDEAKRTNFLEERVRELDRRKWEANREGQSEIAD